MAEKRDMLDDLIDIRDGWQKLSHPLSGITDSLVDPSKAKVFNPADYKQRPRANSMYCLNVAAKREDVCTRCLDLCPVDAIEIHDSTVRVLDHCRECALCVAVCPTEAFLAQTLMSKQLYDKVARIASAYEHCYITCTRALGRFPKENELVLPCVGAISSELWFALLADFSNISVYLPLGICDRCRTTTGEEFYAEQIATAELWSGEAVGLEVEEAELGHEQTRAYKRGQFVSDMARAGASLATTTSPVLMGARAVTERIRQHQKKINEMQRSLEQAVGARTSANRRYILTQRRKQLLLALQANPELAPNLKLEVPVCDFSLCSMCGDCASACPNHACDLDAQGRFSVQPSYCVNCGVCAAVCPEGALSMEPCDPQELVIPDPNAKRAAEQHEKIMQAKAEGRAKLKRGLAALERLAATDTNED